MRRRERSGPIVVGISSEGNGEQIPRLRGISHAAAFVLAVAAAVVLIVTVGAVAWVLLIGAWAGAIAGVVFSPGWIDAPRPLVAGSYLALGWLALIAAPELVRRLDAVPVLLLVAGGVSTRSARSSAS